MRLENLALRWLAEQQYADTTRTTYMETVVLLARRYPLPAQRITTEHLIDFLTTDGDGESTRRAPATLNRHRTTLRCFFRWAHRRGFLRSDPAVTLDDLALGRGRRRAGRWLTRAQALELIDSIDADEVHLHRDRTIVVTALLTGLRRAELAKMRWRDLDHDTATLAVFGKGSKPATVGVPQEALSALAEWQRRADSEGGREVRSGCPVFPSGRQIGGINSEPHYRVSWRTHLAPCSIASIVARHGEAAGLGVIGTHDLRRSFAGWLDEDGVDLAGIQAALRHSTPAVTVACYLDPSPRRAVQATKGLRLRL